MPPFVVFALPRSRTTWLAKYLSYRDWHCGHEESRHWRNLDDVKSWLSQPNTGTVETGIAPFWRLLHRYAPDTKVVTVRRPVKEVVDSLLHLDGVGSLDRANLTKQMRRLDAKLDQIEDRLPDVLSVRSSRLSVFAPAARVFRHCLPYEADFDHWQRLNRTNVQCDMPALFRYAVAYAPQIRKVSAQARASILAELALRRVNTSDAVSFQEEPFEQWYRDGQSLFREHLLKVGEHPEAHAEKNLALMKAHEDAGLLQIVTARANGRMFGYLMTLFAPSWEHSDRTWAINTTIYASPAYPGLGDKLHRAAMKTSLAKGADEQFDRAGARGDGPRMGALFRRHGAELDGQMYRTNLRDS